MLLHASAIAAAARPNVGARVALSSLRHTVRLFILYGARFRGRGYGASGRGVRACAAFPHRSPLMRVLAPVTCGTPCAGICNAQSVRLGGDSYPLLRSSRNHLAGCCTLGACPHGKRCTSLHCCLASPPSRSRRPAALRLTRCSAPAHTAAAVGMCKLTGLLLYTGRRLRRAPRWRRWNGSGQNAQH